MFALVELPGFLASVGTRLPAGRAYPCRFLNRLAYHLRPNWVHCHLSLEGRRVAPPVASVTRLAVAVFGFIDSIVNPILFPSRSIFASDPENK